MFTTLYLSAKGNIWQSTAPAIGPIAMYVGDDKYTRVYYSAASKDAPRTTHGMQIAYVRDGSTVVTTNN